MELLSEEFRSQHGIDDYGYDASGAGAAILPPRKKKGKVGGSTPSTGPKMVPVKISTRVERRKAKSKARKLVSIVTEKEKKDRRVELYASLASSSLTRDEHALLSGSGTLGGALSAKESLKMQLRRQRAGLESLPGDGSTKSSTLQRSREVGGEMGEEEEEDEGEGEGESEDEGEGAKEVTFRKRPRSVEVVQPTVSKKEVVVEEVVEEEGEEEEEDEEDMDGEGELEEEEEEEEEDGEDLDDSEGEEGSDEEDGAEEEEEGSEESAIPAPPPSSFSFKVSLSQLGLSKAVTSKQAPVVVAQQPSTTTDLASESLGRRFLAGKLEQRAIDGEAQEGGVGQQQQQQGGEEAQMSSLFSVPLNGGKRFDEDTRKLLELREKNMLERSGGGGGEEGNHHHVRGTSSGDMLSRREMPGNSAYLATDAWSEDGESEQGEDEEKEGEEEEGGGKRGKGKREVGRKEEIEAEEREKRGGGGPPSLPLSSYSAYAPKHSVTKRGVKEGEARMELPVVRMEQEIMEAALENDVVIIAGETGSGKTTQVPQFFLEAGYGLPPSLVTAYVPQSASATPPTTTPLPKYRPNALYSGIPGMIAVTQPRRVAAVAMATRVGSELGSPLRSGGGGKSMVGYAVRFDSSTVGSGTRIKFLTDGILLREISTDLLLRQYSCIIVDEAHERGVNTDLLLGLLSRALPLRNAMARSQAEDLRKRMEADPTLPLPLPGTPGAPLTPLKLVIMSATLRLEDFSGASARAILFPTLHRPPPVLTVSSRQFPVTVHFSKTTELVDYTGTAVSKVCRMHSKLPEGGILVFLTGQAEVEEAVASLKERLGRSAIKKASKAAAAAVAAAAEASAAVAAAAVAGGGEGEVEGEGEGKAAAASATATTQLSSPPPEKYTPVTILPLFAMLPREDQDKVFIPPPNGHRLIVVATNVAETSITIPGIRYVVDAGRVKRKVYHAASGTSRMEVGWVSQASANQRAGRAGRVGPGHAYRLYSSAVFSDKCPGHEEPEVCSTPLPSLVLTLKSMGIDCVSTFPFPTPPPPNALLAAVRSLTNLGALVPTLKPQPASHTGSSTTTGRGGSTNPSPLLLGSHIPTLQAIGKEELTPLGALLARLPLYPPLAKAMVLAWQAQCSARGSSDGSGGGGDGEEHPAHNLLRHTALAVASMTVENLLWVPSGAPPRRVGGKKRVSVILEKVEGGGGKVEEEDLDGDLDEEGEVDPDLEAELRKEGGVGGEEGEEREGMDAALALSWEKAKKDRQAAQAAHALLRHPLSDALTMLSMVGAFSYASASSSPAEKKRTERGFCKEHWLRMKAMVEVLALGDQLINTMEVCLGGSGGEGEALIASAGGDESEERGGGDNGGTIKNTPSSGGGSEGGAVKEHPPLPPPSPLTQTLIRQVIASGYIEHIAKRPTPSLSAALCAAARVPIGSGWTPYLPASASVSTGIAAGAAAALASGELNSAQGGKEGESAALEGAARSLGMGGGLEASVAGGGGGGGDASTLPPCIWVHPHSSVYSSDTSLMPPLIVFTSITFGKAGRAYARCVTAIEESWLPSLAGGTPLLSWSPPLPGSSFYDATSDAVCASFTPVFGDGAWRLKPVPRPLLSHGGGEGGGGGGGGQKDTLDTVVRLFARAILEGVAVKGLAQWSSHLAAPPSSVTKKSPTKRVLQLVYALMKPEEHARGGKLAHAGPVVCKAHLADVWRVCPGFLAGEVAAWVKEGEMERFSAQWPRLVRDFLKECN